MNTSAVLADGAYAVDPAASRLAWHGSKVIGKTHTGTVDIKSGELTVRGGRLAGGSFILDMKTIKSDENLAALVQHLQGADFFDTANYPEAQLVITGVAASAKTGEYRAKADLTIKGHANSLDFTATVGAVDGGLEAASDFSIDRSKWDVRYGSGKFFDNLGDNLINDLIAFKISLQARRQ
jgi:polyisoprenoid-binding protein YceI